MVAGALLASAVAAAPAGAVVSVDGEIGQAVNAARASASLPGYAFAGDLAAVAGAWAGQLAASGVLAHNPALSSQVSGWSALGENVGYGPTADAVHQAFMNSAGHRANVLSARFSQVGIGSATSPDGRLWVVEVFRAPAGASAPQAASAPAPAPAAAPAPSLPAQAGYPALRVGSRGAVVKALQQRLGVPATGKFRSMTRSAVKRVQRAHGLRANGVVNRATWAALGF
jgi:pyruvate/2-oxoglutarate dehydrogenase complex dihydrolipoamide acyltransferase (E2) component